MKYLGIIFDSHMTFTSHLNKLTAKAGRRLNTIRRLSRTYWGAAPAIIRTLYQSCVEPIIKYGAEIWITSLKTQEGTRRLDRVSRLAGLTIAGLDSTTSMETATLLARITPLSELATETLLRTAPQADNREEEPHRLPDPTTHCTPLNLLRAKLRQMLKEETNRSDRRKQELDIEQAIKSKIQGKNYKKAVKEFIERRVNRR